MSDTIDLTLGCGSADIEEILSDARRLVEPALRDVLATLPGELREVADFHFGWRNAGGDEISGGGGKSLRPALAFACARAAGGPVEAAAGAAAAVELVHNFSLLHDDIMDGDLTRRHRPTAWTAFGVSRALLTGDALFVLAVDLVNDGPAGAALRASMLELCAGQSDDLTFENRAAVTLPECLDMAEKKTGALLGVACQLGALSVTQDLCLANAYRDFGRHLGVAFQLVDDVLGIWGHESLTGKPVASDLKSRKKSFPVVAALSSGTAAGAELATLYRSGTVLGERELALAADLVERAGGRAWAENEAARHCSAALALLATAEPDPVGLAELRALAELVTARVC
nr:polyprenyl synthetase family protein [Mycobacterium gordonae]